ncbi:hypothetical protein NXS98_07250 [Fontisphaera persica]|uniref:hypothetical protein n=1 Tax=Fontisphaera persica TaxID=2974023 RepID=UPI0024BF266A|nr:hypothetical protein [Fontisphaera persica]WCJ60909.1 hypothetical protein NXS98_07250 [Fontisphaera persica]
MFESEEVRHHLPDCLNELGGQLDVDAYAKVLVYLAQKQQRSDVSAAHKYRAVFVRYLRMIDSLGSEFTTNVLKSQGLMLLSARGEWKSPTQLAWPTHGIVSNDQLDDDFSQALSNLRARANQVSINIELENGLEPFEEAYKNTAQCLCNYFAPWRDYVPPEIIGAFISILGDGFNGQVKVLAANYLGQNSVEGAGGYCRG